MNWTAYILSGMEFQPSVGKPLDSEMEILILAATEMRNDLESLNGGVPLSFTRTVTALEVPASALDEAQALLRLSV